MSGMHWFPWHHGTSSDPRFRLIARQAGCKEADCIAVWANILEQASSAEDRGAVTNLNFELTGLPLGLDQELVGKIVDAMNELGFLTKGRITDWERKWELRHDPTNAKRQKRHRERHQDTVTLRNDTGQDSTEQDTTEHKKKQERIPPF